MSTPISTVECPLPTAQDIIDIYVTQLKPQGVAWDTGSYAVVDEETGKVLAVCALGALAVTRASKPVEKNWDVWNGAQRPIYQADDDALDEALPWSKFFCSGVAQGFDFGAYGAAQERDYILGDDPTDEELALWDQGVEVGVAVRTWAGLAETDLAVEKERA